MTNTSKIGRNDPCSCGSGKKFKLCCEGKAVHKANTRTKWAAVILGGLLLIGALAMVSSMTNSDLATAQPGKVWSPEHGHYH